MSEREPYCEAIYQYLRPLANAFGSRSNCPFTICSHEVTRPKSLNRIDTITIANVRTMDGGGRKQLIIKVCIGHAHWRVQSLLTSLMMIT